MKNLSIIILLFFVPLMAFTQTNENLLMGEVYSKNSDELKEPLVGVNVYWLGTTNGAVTDTDGNFQLKKLELKSKLVISYVSFLNDTIETKGKNFVSVNLQSSVSLKSVDIVHRRKSTEISFANPIKVEQIGVKELQKAACCNLSESFETTPSVDVSFTDAVTGTRQIQMLGLAGPYTQITLESLPNVRGLSALYGLVYIPGTWVESIQLNKGTGSVTNGFESIAGQINVELQKPEKSDKLFLNAYLNQEGRMEANANYSYRLKGGKWSTALLLHANQINSKNDHNNDGFLDVPLTDHIIALNRWKYIGDDGIRLQFGIKGIYIENLGGQEDFDPDALIASKWGMNVINKRVEGWAKIGKVFERMPWKTVGIQLSGSGHKHDSYFGAKEYDAEQNSFYANLIYLSILGNTKHKFSTGASLQYDDYKEMLVNTNYDREEIVPGAYFEYTYAPSDKLNVVSGIRGDYHNHFGSFVTPRLHIRYAPTESLVIRGSAGRGQRTASIISENIGLLASSRTIKILGDNSDKPFGLNPEVAWNFGLNLTQCFELNNREGSVSLDYYRTDFENQIVLDVDHSPDSALFYNLEGNSFSNSVQLQVNYELVKRFDIKMAYRWYDVWTDYTGALLRKPLVASHRAFINLAYETANSWKFDYTLSWQGSKRIPSTAANPIEYQLDKESPDFIMMNTQVTKSWNENFDVYVGVENVLDYKQDNPILASADPFGPYFDSSLIWGPIFGRNAYVGLRYKIK